MDYSPGSDDDTWAVFTAIEWGATDWLTIFFDGFVDVDDVRGGFLDVGLRMPPPEVCPYGVFSFEPYVLLGWDVGYVSGPRRIKENHWQFGIEQEAELTVLRLNSVCKLSGKLSCKRLFVWLCLGSK